MINDLYKTNIWCVDDKYTYSLKEKCTIQVQIVDYNNNPIKNKKLTVIIREKNDVIEKQYAPGTTDSNGMITVDYTCDYPSTFQITCNNQSIYVSYDGWKLHEQGVNGFYELYYCKDWIRLILKGGVVVSGNWKVIDTIRDKTYSPHRDIVTMVNWGNTINVCVTHKGEVKVRDVNGGSWNAGLNADIYYPRFQALDVGDSTWY